MSFMKTFIRIVDRFNEFVGRIVSWLTTLMVLVVFYDVVLRYVFNNGNIALQELEWHLFSIIFLLGSAYTLKKNGHVRVDILYTNFKDRTKAWINLFGSLFFLLPFSIMILISTQDFVTSSWMVGEVSPNPGGLPARYILKAMIPLGFFFLILQGLAECFKNILFLKGDQ
jgi:TRAP-type mannitol/chloroaromatic compound transport system permease small subunit